MFVIFEFVLFLGDENLMEIRLSWNSVVLVSGNVDKWCYFGLFEVFFGFWEVYLILRIFVMVVGVENIIFKDLEVEEFFVMLVVLMGGVYYLG